MSLQTIVGAAEAAGLLAEAQALGETITLAHRGAAAITLYAITKPIQSGRVEEGRTVSEGRIIECLIPVGQTGFAYPTSKTEPVIDGDVIVWRGRNHYVQPPIEHMADGHIYRVRAIDVKPISTGPNT